MKDLNVAVVLLIALILYFSCFGYTPMETQIKDGYAPRHNGDSGLIIPGDGELLAEVTFEPESMPGRSEHERIEKAEVTEITKVTEETELQPNINKTSTEETTKENKEENEMDGMLISFWHGVAAVLIGETSALMVALAWMKIRGDKDV